jgi:hypothetical protein
MIFDILPFVLFQKPRNLEITVPLLQCGLWERCVWRCKDVELKIMLRSVTRSGTLSKVFKYSSSRNGLSQMRRYTAPLNDMQFLIEEVFQFPERYLEIGYDKNLVSKEMITSILNETAKFAESELANLDETGDSIGTLWHSFTFS